MSYKTIKAGLAGILKTLGYQESDEPIMFKNASPREAGVTFIILAEKGELSEGPNGNGETISSLFYDQQSWTIQIMLQRSEHNDIINRDEILEAKDSIIREIDDPANWNGSYVRLQKYLSWELEPQENRFIIKIRVKIIDTITY